ncbi:MAG: adenylosuccinate synthase [Candidatus Thorarchaeota archaeon]
MRSLVVVGLQWGDEGKGKIVDWLAEKFDVVSRFQGGPNAGHTLVVGKDTFRFRMLPSGAARGKKLVIGNGVVVDPQILLDEIEQVESRGFHVDLLLSERAHVITPYHARLDAIYESHRAQSKVGTTLKGVGPTYSQKASRVGVRICDLLQPRDAQQWSLHESVSLREIGGTVGQSDTVPRDVYEACVRAVTRLAGYVGDSGEFLRRSIESGKSVLFEGAQGTMLDIDHGTYPFVTSSNCVAAAASTGTGVPFSMLDRIIGVSKAYTTRVGSGPFPTELNDDVGEAIRRRGNEFGTVTGRPRRCGWLDLVALRYAVRVNGAAGIALTKIDVLEGLKPLRVCVAYDIDGTEFTTVPARIEDYSRAVPVYEELRGWSHSDYSRGSTDQLQDLLPPGLSEYVHLVERYTGARVSLISLGPERSQTVVIDDGLLGP